LNLVDVIEMHIKTLLEESNSNKVLLRRNELAQYFGCAPSQINYVIQTRFSMERGYVTESQRGGGGYIRVIRLDLAKIEKLLPTLASLDQGGASQRQALDFIHWLLEQQLISQREAGIMSSIMDRTVLGLELPFRDGLRARMLVAMVEAILGCGEE
jgi:transcriptional regulator CtsR